MSTAIQQARSTVRELLITAGEELPAPARERILSLGPTAVPELVAVMFDETLLDLEVEGWAPHHAATLLGELRAVDAAPALLRRILNATREGSDLDVSACAAIRAMRPDAHAHLLAALDDPALSSIRDVVCDLLATQGVHDDRTLAELLARCDEDWDEGPARLASHGDPRALPHLMRALVRERALHVRGRRRGGADLTPLACELVRAIRDHGGSPPREELEAFERLERTLDELA
jgi:hypothetical protein